AAQWSSVCGRSPEVHHPGPEDALDSIDDLTARRNPEREREDRLLFLAVLEVEKRLARTRVRREDVAQTRQGVAVRSPHADVRLADRLGMRARERRQLVGDHLAAFLGKLEGAR